MQLEVSGTFPGISAGEEGLKYWEALGLSVAILLVANIRNMMLSLKRSY